jgi:hypothetical protein
MDGFTACLSQVLPIHVSGVGNPPVNYYRVDSILLAHCFAHTFPGLI